MNEDYKDYLVYLVMLLLALLVFTNCEKEEVEYHEHPQEIPLGPTVPTPGG